MPERIRPFDPADLETCYAISLATGFEGGDASHLYRDPKMMGHIYMAPYVCLEPGLALVVEDDGVGWIGPDNIKNCLSSLGNSLGRNSLITDNHSTNPFETQKKKKHNRKKPSVQRNQEDAKVACLTTDFSMQNVLMQMGLKVMSVDGLLVKAIRQFVLRCMACYQVHLTLLLPPPSITWSEFLMRQ